MSRAYDAVLLGASGFTGALTAEYLEKNAPEGFRWAVAGRNKSKLERFGRDVLYADVTDPRSLRELAESTKVVATTVGPYVQYGEPLVAACAEAGTGYLDLTGEPEFLDRMYVRYHERATQTGARIVHACGFDSIPYDLGVQFTVEQLPENVPIQVDGLLRAGGRPSGGTFHTAITAFSRPKQNLEAHRARRAAEGRPQGRKARAVPGRIHRQQGFWAVPLPTIDPQIVGFSARLLERYGPDFRYSHYAALKRLPTVAAGIGGVGLLVAGAQVPPVRNALLKRLQPGDGPSAETRARSWFNVRFIGRGGGKQVVTEVAGRDPGYDETAKMLGESMLCLALDDLPETAGQTTTAAATGPALRDRLVRAGMTFATLEVDSY
ncbi:saccharopine dehydrogenase family protein [Kribbella sp.]|uniref:saccharopine dehydrogenase family protein n=1 Tax=Kribbella sp. TaxID=1871183 RepID=UPI002D3D95D7|nr:saccharopine dehydrogenase NADP-binding domain-containing protein [Kribbella sp.]HZX08608.1 saccharopine dehydrogenase NADP-binding domain-containing protein [Kribbella sp.]